MNEDLFKNALTSIVIATDYQNWLDSGQSFIHDGLMALDHSKEEADDLLDQLGSTEERAAAVYLECLEAFDAEKAFEKWSEQPGIFDEIRQGILDSLAYDEEAEEEEESE